MMTCTTNSCNGNVGNKQSLCNKCRYKRDKGLIAKKHNDEQIEKIKSQINGCPRYSYAFQRQISELYFSGFYVENIKKAFDLSSSDIRKIVRKS